MSHLVSIIIPIYNTEQYLSRCIESILSQSFTDFELLLIDDGSTDGSGAICDVYVEKDSRVCVFHKENGGVSSARNVGLDNAKGDWICFVDSDDELIPNGLQVMVEGVSEKVCMVMGGYRELEGNRLIVDTDTMGMNGRAIDRAEALLMMYPTGDEDKIYMGYPWGKLFDKRMVKNYGLLFDECIAIKEDTLFVVDYLCQSEKHVFFTSIPVYNYLKVATGAMGSLSVSYNSKYLTSFDAVVKMNRLIQKLPDLGKKLSDAAKYEVVNRCYLIYGYMLQNNTVDEKIIAELKKRAIKEVGLGYYFGFQYNRNKRRIKNFFNKKMNIK